MKFGNTANKIRAIVGVMRNNELVKGREISERLARLGYAVNEGHITMFIYHNMLYKYVERERVNGLNYYKLAI